jgi:hypothetical protein
MIVSVIVNGPIDMEPRSVWSRIMIATSTAVPTSCCVFFDVLFIVFLLDIIPVAGSSPSSVRDIIHREILYLLRWFFSTPVCLIYVSKVRLRLEYSCSDSFVFCHHKAMTLKD